jgi:hypothetical protein
MSIPPLSVGEDKLANAESLSIARVGQVRKYDRLRMRLEARLDLFQVRRLRWLLSSKDTILRLFGRAVKKEGAK